MFYKIIKGKIVRGILILNKVHRSFDKSNERQDDLKKWMETYLSNQVDFKGVCNEFWRLQ